MSNKPHKPNTIPLRRKQIKNIFVAVNEITQNIIREIQIKQKFRDPLQAKEIEEIKEAYKVINSIADCCYQQRRDNNYSPICLRASRRKISLSINELESQMKLYIKP